MGLLGVALGIVGLAIMSSSWLLTRAHKLTMGQGALWVLIGLLWVALGILSRSIIRVLGGDANVLLMALVVCLLAGLLWQAVLLSRAQTRVRRLAADLALLRHEREDTEPPAR